MKDGCCALCKRNTKLCKSHIIPRAILKKIKQFHGKQVEINPDEGSTKFGQSDYYEYLLCKKCECAIKIYEDYGIPFFRQNTDRHLDNNRVIFKNIEYPLLKLYLTSLAWRVSVSKTFENLKLETELEEKSRLSLLENNPLDEHILACLITKITDLKKHGGQGRMEKPEELITTPFIEGNRLHFVIQGFMFEFSLRELSKNIKGLLTKEKEQFFSYTLFDQIPHINQRKLIWNTPQGKLKDFDVKKNDNQ